MNASAQNFRLVGHSKATAPERILQRHASCADAPAEDFYITSRSCATRILEWKATSEDEIRTFTTTKEHAGVPPNVVTFQGDMNLFQMFLGEHFDVSEPIKAIKPSIDASGNMLIWFANPIYCPNMKRPHSEVPHTFFVAHRRLKKLYMKCKDCQCKKINLKREKA